MPHVQLPQGRIDFLDQGRGRPVVFVHPYLMGGELWQDLADRLSGDEVRCLMPTWPLGAHHTALDDPGAATVHGVADIVASFLEALDLTDVVLVGGDSGGAISQLVITRHPDRIGALVLMNCDAFEVFPPAPFGVLRPIAKAGLLRAALAGLRFAAVRRSRLGFGALSNTDLDHLGRRWVRPHREDRGVYRDLVRLTASIDKRVTLAVAGELAHVRQPVLIVWGTGDPLFPLSLGQRLQAAFADARLETIAGRCLIMVDHPDRVAELVGPFAQATRRPAPSVQ